MAGSTTAHLKSVKGTLQNKDTHSHLAKGNADSNLSLKKESKKNPSQLMKTTIRYEGYAKSWSIVSTVAAAVSVASAVFSVTNAVYGVIRKRHWF